MTPETLSMKDKLLEFIEKDRFSFTTALIYVFILGAIRSILEAAVGSYDFYSRYLFFQHVLLSYPEILMGVLFVYLITRINIKKIWNVFLFGFWILLLPPITDYVVFGESGSALGESYEYLKVEEIIPAITKFWNPFYLFDIASKGQGTMFLMMMFGTTGYVAMKTDLFKKLVSITGSTEEIKRFFISLGKTLVTYLSISYLFLLIGSFSFVVHLESSNLVIFNYFKFEFPGKYYLFFQRYGYGIERIIPSTNSGQLGLSHTLIGQQRHLFLSSFFIILTIIMGLTIAYILSKRKMFIMLKNISWVRSVAVLSASILGVLSVHMLDPDFTKGWALDPRYILHLPYLFLIIITVFSLTQFSTLVNDLWEYKRDEDAANPLGRGEISRYHYIHLIAGLALASLFFSFILGNYLAIISIIWIVLSMVWTMNDWGDVIGGMKTAFIASLAFLFGFYTPGSWIAFFADYTQNPADIVRESVSRVPDLTFNILIILLWIFLGFWFLTTTKDMLEGKDGFFKGKKNIILAPSSALLLLFPLIYIQSVFASLFFVVIAIIAPIWYRLLDNIDVVWILFIVDILVFGFSLLT